MLSSCKNTFFMQEVTIDFSHIPLPHDSYNRRVALNETLFIRNMGIVAPTTIPRIIKKHVMPLLANRYRLCMNESSPACPRHITIPPKALYA